MAGPKYHFLDRWRVEGSVQEVTEILRQAENYASWWGSTYIKVDTLKKGDENDVGAVSFVRAKGWLPYLIEFEAKVTESHHPHGFSLETQGDLTGIGIWTITQDGNMVDVIYDWTIQADKPLLRYFSFLMRPIFRSNHNWTMRKGEQGLKLELQHRRCKTEQEHALIPPFPQPVSYSPIQIIRAAFEAMG